LLPGPRRQRALDSVDDGSEPGAEGFGADADPGCDDVLTATVDVGGSFSLVMALPAKADEVLGQIDPAAAAHPPLHEAVVRITALDRSAASLARARCPKERQG